MSAYIHINMYMCVCVYAHAYEISVNEHCIIKIHRPAPFSHPSLQFMFCPLSQDAPVYFDLNAFGDTE